MTATTVVLRDDGWSVRVQPQFGGSLAACEFRGQTILAPVREPNPWPGVELCYYPLVPFANRIESSRFSFAGRAIGLEPNIAGYPHAIHGQGWQADWQLTDAARTACALAFEHTASPRWPWDYRATQTFAIGGNELKIGLTLHNSSTTRMPAGLGFHPFFPQSDSARLTASAAGLWSGNAEEFPRRMDRVPPAFDFARGRPIRDARGIDRCYSGWRRRAEIDWPDAEYRVAIAAGEPLAHLMLYVPRDRDFFCVEPVSHVVDAVNFARGDANAMLELEPGQELSVAMTLTAASRAA